MNKPSLTDRISQAIRENDTTRGLIKMGPVETPARSYISPTDTYDNEIGFESELHGHAPGRMRGMWLVQDQQQANVPVTVLTASGETNSNAIAAIQGGIPQNPKAPASVWASVPQMSVNLAVTGPVMIDANLSVKSSAASDTVAFAIYRDGQLIGNHLTHTLPSATSSASLVQMTAFDNPPNGNHVYSLYWSPGTGTLVAVSNQRNLYAINLSPR